MRQQVSLVMPVLRKLHRTRLHRARVPLGPQSVNPFSMHIQLLVRFERPADAKITRERGLRAVLNHVICQRPLSLERLLALVAAERPIRDTPLPPLYPPPLNSSSLPPVQCVTHPQQRSLQTGGFRESSASVRF